MAEEEAEDSEHNRPGLAVETMQEAAVAAERLEAQVEEMEEIGRAHV